MSVRDRLRKPPPAAPNPAPGPATESPEESAPPPPTIPKPDRGTALRGTGATTPTGTLPRFRIGDWIADTFLVKRVIEGGMGTVYVAHHKRWQIDLVVKVPHADVLQNLGHSHRIEAEAKAWTDLGMHPHIAYCYYVLPLDGVPLVVIEYLDGGNLRDWIADGRCADLRVGLDLAIQACHGLECAHAKGLIHRDIKPENILLASDGTLKITDFGIARMADRPVGEGTHGEQSVAVGGTVGGIGTYEYMAPEQFVSAHDVDARADIFSLGVCLYEMLCGRRPYAIATGPWRDAPDPQAFRRDIALPKMLCALLQLCVDWDPARRPASARDLRLALCKIYEEHFNQRSPWADLPEVSLEAAGWNNRGVSYLELGNQDEALRCFAQALQTNPTHLEATFNQGLLQWRRGEIDDLEILCRLDRSVIPGADPKALAIAKAEIHQERCAPDAACEILAPYPGLYAACFAGKESSRIRLLTNLSGHSEWVFSVALTPDGRLGLSGSRDSTLKLWDLTTGQCLRTLAGHSGWVRSVALTPDGRLGLSGSGDLKLWDLTIGQCLRTIDGDSGPIRSVALTPDGRLGLSGHEYRTLKLWDLTTGQCLRTIDGHSRSVDSVALTPDGRLGLSGSEDHTLKLWDLTTGQCLRTLGGHSNEVLSVAFTPDGRLGLSGSRDHTLKLWDLTTGQCLRTLAGHSSLVLSVALTPDGRLGLSGSEDTTLKLWDLTTGQCLRTFAGYWSSVSSVALTPDGRLALSGNYDTTLKLWALDVSGKIQQPYRVSTPRSLAMLRIEQQKRGQQLHATAALCAARKYPQAYKALIALWEPIGFRADERTDALYLQLVAHGRPGQLLSGTSQSLSGVAECTSVALTPDGRLGLSGSEDRTLKLWDLTTGQCLRTIEGDSGMIRSVALTPDGRHGLSGGGGAAPQLWDLTTGQCLHTLAGHSNEVLSVALTSDGRRGLSGSLDHTLKLWDLTTGQCLRTFGPPVLRATDPNLTVFSVALTPDGRLGLSGGGDRTLKLWDLTTGQCLRTLEGHSGMVRSVALTPDGRLGLSGGDDRTLKLWDLTTGQCLHTLEGHLGSVNSVALTPDGRLGLSGSWDRTLKLWDVTTGQCLRTWSYSEPIRAVALTPNGRRALVAYRNRPMEYWRFIWSLEFPGHT